MFKTTCASYGIYLQYSGLNWNVKGIHSPPLSAKLLQQFTGYGESYEDNAVRELEEEMGITGACLETLFDFWYSDNTCRLWGRLFR